MRAQLKDFIAGPLSAQRPDADAARAFLERELHLGKEPAEGTPKKSKQKKYLLGGVEPLFSYQREVVEAVQGLLNQKETRAMVSLPTGGGKTRTALWLFRLLLQKNRVRRLLWVAPSTELVEQAEEALRSIWSTHYPSLPLQVITNDLGSTHIDHNVAGSACFATTQLASRRIDSIRKYGPDLLVFDEAHQAAARTSRALIRAAHQEASSIIVGLSATPGRSLDDESEMLCELFGGNLVSPSSLGPDPVDALRTRGVLSQIELRKIPLPKQWEHLRVIGSTGSALNTDELATNSARFWSIVDTASKIGAKRRCLVFASSIAHCHALGAAIGAHGLRIGVLTHHLSQPARQKILGLFAAGGIDVLLNKSILTTGYDLPELEDAVLATPVRSAVQWEQIVGRISRGPAVGGTKIGRIWEIDDHFSLHKRVMSAQRYSGTVW